MKYYAIAITNNNKIGQLLVNKESGKKHTQEWTGKIYPSYKVAYADLAILNTVEAIKARV